MKCLSAAPGEFKLASKDYGRLLDVMPLGEKGVLILLEEYDNQAARYMA